MRTIVGIDPGVTGAVAIFYHATLSTVFDIPFIQESSKSKKRIDAVQLVYLLGEHLWCLEGHYAIYMELAQAMPKQGVSSMFAYGRTNGVIEGVLAGLGFMDKESTLKKVPPAVWKRRLNLLSNVHPKDAGLHKARELYPHAELHLKKHHNRADAILIGHYGCQMEGLVK
jgi:crossover junction endodeoxyribonuclease RuvC